MVVRKESCPVRDAGRCHCVDCEGCALMFSKCALTPGVLGAGQ